MCQVFCLVAVNNLRFVCKSKNSVCAVFHSVFKMRDLSGACLKANKHSMFLISLATTKRDFSAPRMIQFKYGLPDARKP